MGDPREPTDPRIQQALADALPLTGGYPRAVGLPELREAVAAWCERRFGVELDPEREVIPTLGSKEAIFTFAQLLVDPEGGKDVVVVTEPGYPVPERGAAFAQAEVVSLPLREEHGFLPDLDAVDDETWERAAVVWVNYPNNPTGATRPARLLRASRPTSPPSTTSSSPRTRPTPSSGSTSRRSPRSTSAIAPASRSSTA